MDYARRAREAGDEVEPRIIPGAGHMALVDPRSPSWTSTADRLDRRFTRRLTPGP